MPFVLDASATMTWCFADEATPETQALLHELPLVGAVVPALWYFEVANILATSIRKKRISLVEAGDFLRTLDKSRIQVEDRIKPIDGNNLLPLVLQYGLTAYDAAYLELAKRKQYALATLDRELIAAAQLEGIQLILPTP